MLSPLVNCKDFFSERTIQGMNRVVANYLAKDVKYKRWYTIIWPRDLLSTGLPEVTQHSTKTVRMFLKNLRYLPLALECDLMEKLHEELFLTSPAADDIRGSFRGTFK